MGHQVLALVLATEEAILPLDSQIYISGIKAGELNTVHKVHCVPCARCTGAE